MDRICVLMSTYNGELFLKEQIDSILQQGEVNVQLIIRDDGSKDGTLTILKEYHDKGLLEYSAGNNLGYAGSFLQLLKDAPECDYYAFSDQDDIWLKEKLYNAIESLKRTGKTRQLYCSNLQIFQDNHILGLMRTPDVITDKYKCLNQSICTGCTIVIDNEFRHFVLSNLPAKVNVHDLWMFHTAVYLGNIIYDNDAFILYRQHGDNQIGAKYTRIARMRSRMRSLKTFTSQHEKEEEAMLLLKVYGHLINQTDLEVIKKVAFYKKTLCNRISLMVDKRYNTSIFDKARILLGVY